MDKAANDHVAARLQREGMAERPSFSPELHALVLTRIGAERTRASALRLRARKWMPAAAALAALVLVAVAVPALYMAYDFRHTPEPTASAPFKANKPPSAESGPLARTSDAGLPELRVGGFLSASIWPPRIAIAAQSRVATNTESIVPATAAEDVPNSLLDTLAAPADGAGVALSETVPPEFASIAVVGRTALQMADSRSR